MTDNCDHRPEKTNWFPRPLSLFERQAEAKRLREEAHKLIAEAERLEDGCKKELELFDQMISDAIKKAYAKS